MKISITENSALSQIEVNIATPRMNETTTKIVELLQTFDKKITGKLNGQICIVDLEDVLYIESVDKRTFLYLIDQALESDLRLYELEDRLEGADFIRISRQMIVNFRHVKRLQPEMGARMRMTLSNGENVIVSRQYSTAVKQKLSLI